MNQEYFDKTGVLTGLLNRKRVVLELGCGPNKRIPDALGIDALDFDGVDIVTDLNRGLGFIPDSSVDNIYSYHFLEHLDDLSSLMREVHRVLKPGGGMIGKVPHFANPYYYSDPTHKSRFGLYTFCYFSDTRLFTRQVPRFYNNIIFDIKILRLIFHSEFPARNLMKKAVQGIFGLTYWLLEYYEENLVYICPPYEIYFHLVKSS